MLTREGCIARQDRFRRRLGERDLSGAVISDPRDVYYFTGFGPATYPALLYLGAPGGSWLVCHTAEGDAAVDDRSTYDYQVLYTMNPDPVRCMDRVVEARVRGASAVPRLGWQVEALPRRIGESLQVGLRPDAWTPIDDDLAAQQEFKDPDEVDVLRKAIACSLAAYTAAAEAIRPGVNELEVLEAGHRAATLEAGEPIYHGGDYRCGEFGGPARDRRIEAGELYTIDAQSTYRGYWSDLSRAFAVAEPSGLQASVYDHVAAILRDIPSQVRPGGSTTALWRWIDSRIREHPTLQGAGLVHHGGHGVGTRCHEAPDLNRDRGGAFAVGNVFSCEPGAYLPEMQYGVRLENTFLITDDGIENLSEYPLDLRAALH